MKGRKEFHRRVYDFLDSIGATKIAFIEGKRHGRFVFNYQGQDLVVYCSSSPSDCFAHKHAMGDIRRLIRRCEHVQEANA